jgi:CDP-diacylglycerol--glycerol-3-phosphate 3-phosphatidyltransferase
MTVANYVTFFRIFVSPIFLVVYLEHDLLGIKATMLPYVLLFLMGVSELSDLFDGYLARKFNQVTDFGKIFDPMADSIARLTVFLAFTGGVVQVPLLLVFIFFYRDSVISTLRTICALRGFALAARRSGKIKAVIQAIAAFLIVIAMIPHSMGVLSSEHLRLFSSWAVGIAALYTLYSGADYIYANRLYIHKLLNKKPNSISANHHSNKNHKG